ncbi:RuvX/YqgF family protein [Skeletonema marinoi]|uniref:RuvX/YqgF family protein n=1 Tax=Skeletonema marinoi TaxID=267567 RepID=A0AAD9D6U9_9STRA|nr:RuvX/YqgF family protein [Skeletonema marinoi]
MIMMANYLSRVVLLIALLYKPISFAFAPPYRQQATAASHIHVYITTCQSANQDQEDDIISVDDTSSSSSPQPAASEEAFSTLRSIGEGITTATRHLSNLNTTELSTTIVNYVISEQATNIVLGLPLHKDGSDSEQSNITREFGQFLLQEVRKRCGTIISITLWDERYTSKEAASRIQAEAIARKSRIPSASELETELDADAACIILEDYYKELGEDGELIVLENEAVERECAEIYVRNMELQEERRRSMMEKREKGRNARQEMIARAKALEESANNDGLNQRRKRRRRKRRNNSRAALYVVSFKV